MPDCTVDTPARPHHGSTRLADRGEGARAAGAGSSTRFVYALGLSLGVLGRPGELAARPWSVPRHLRGAIEVDAKRRPPRTVSRETVPEVLPLFRRRRRPARFPRQPAASGTPCTRGPPSSRASRSRAAPRRPGSPPAGCDARTLDRIPVVRRADLDLPRPVESEQRSSCRTSCRGSSSTPATR